jgi:uncharacterized protein YjbI with pentapeptide repeats
MQLSTEEIQRVLQENKDLKKQLDRISSGQKANHKRFFKTSIRGVKFWAGADLNSSFDRVYQELPSVTKPAFAQLSASIVKRLTRVGFFAILFAVIPAFFLLIQTVILFQQNKKLEQQNDKIEQQVYLEEANRRNNLVFLMDNVLDIVHDELEQSPGLTPPTIARIQSLMYGFRPYKFLEDDKLTKPLSPEKGQFLLALINSGISKRSMQKIFNTSFNNVYLKGATMFEVNLENVDMPASDLQGADLYNANLKNANLNATNLSYAQLRKANLANAYLQASQLTNANLTDVILDGAFLEGANLENANLTNTSLDGAHVGSKKWLDELKDWNITGADTILNTYSLDGPHTNEYDDEYYIVVRRKG